MFKYIRRFFYTHTHKVGLFFGVLSVGFLVGKPIYTSYIESTDEKIASDPVRQKLIQRTEARRELIKKKYKEYKECKDPEEKARLFKELSDIHVQRYMELNRNSFSRTD